MTQNMSKILIDLKEWVIFIETYDKCLVKEKKTPNY